MIFGFKFEFSKDLALHIDFSGLEGDSFIGEFSDCR